MDIIAAFLIAVMITASSVVTAVGVGVGCFAFGSIYQYRTSQTEVQQVRHELNEQRENFSMRYQEYREGSKNNIENLKATYKQLDNRINQANEGF